MAMNLDQALNNARNIITGEAAGSIKFAAVFVLAVAVWIGVILINGWTEQSTTNLNAQQSRLKTLLSLSEEYKTLAPSRNNQSNTSGNVDVAAVFAQVSERMQLGSRVNRIAPDGRNQSVEINRLYAEEFVELQNLLAARGVRFIAMELRALPAGQERLFTISAIIGPMN